MQKASYSNEKIGRLATISQAKERYKLGRAKIMEVAQQSDAIRRFGRAVRIDIEVMDKAIDAKRG